MKQKSANQIHFYLNKIMFFLILLAFQLAACDCGEKSINGDAHEELTLNEYETEISGEELSPEEDSTQIPSDTVEESENYDMVDSYVDLEPDGELSFECPVEETPHLLTITEYNDVSHALAYAGGYVFSTNYTDDTVVVIDTKTFTVVSSIAVGPGPYNLETDLTRLFVVNSMAREAAIDHYLSIIDISSLSVVHEIPVSEKPQGSDPMNYPWTNFPWDATYLDETLFVTFPTNAQPDILPVSLIDYSEGTFFPAGSGPGCLTAASNKLFVINGRSMVDPTDDAIVVFQPDGTPITTLETSGKLTDVWKHTDGLVYAARSITDSPEDEILRINPETYEWDAIVTCDGPYTFSSFGSILITACTWAKKLDLIDTASSDSKTTIDLTSFDSSISMPRGVTVDGCGNIYIESEGKISVLIGVLSP